MPGGTHTFHIKRLISRYNVMVLIPLDACGDFSYKIELVVLELWSTDWTVVFALIHVHRSLKTCACRVSVHRSILAGYVTNTYVHSVRLSYLCIKIWFPFPLFTIYSAEKGEIWKYNNESVHRMLSLASSASREGKTISTRCCKNFIGFQSGSE